ncbi:MAG: NAD-dependent epimerase/dehydratase family protein [Candidatus Nitrospinota bacterium M3_3B_026]
MRLDRGAWLVTGGAGFIGSHVVDAALLEDAGAVVALDNLLSGRRDNLSHIRDERFRFVEGDYGDGPLLDRLFAEFRFTHVLHVGAVAGYARGAENPERCLRGNVIGTYTLLEKAKKRGVVSFVYASSSGIYGDGDILPIKEGAPDRPRAVYTVSKQAAENLCLTFNKLHGVNAVSLRFNNAYGPRERGDEYTGVAARFLRNALSGEPLTVMGTGDETRDFIYVTDLAKAVVMAAKADGLGGEIVNIGGGVETRIAGLAERILDITGRRREGMIKSAPPLPDRVKRKSTSVEKAERTLGFRAEISLDEGLRRTAAWMAEALALTPQKGEAG